MENYHKNLISNKYEENYSKQVRFPKVKYLKRKSGSTKKGVKKRNKSSAPQGDFNGPQSINVEPFHLDSASNVKNIKEEIKVEPVHAINITEEIKEETDDYLSDNENIDIEEFKLEEADV